MNPAVRTTSLHVEPPKERSQMFSLTGDLQFLADGIQHWKAPATVRVFVPLPLRREGGRFLQPFFLDTSALESMRQRQHHFPIPKCRLVEVELHQALAIERRDTETPRCGRTGYFPAIQKRMPSAPGSPDQTGALQK